MHPRRGPQGVLAQLRTGRLQALYTGVRLKGATYDGPATREYAPGEPMIETVMLADCTGAGADADAGELREWAHGRAVILEPPELGATLKMLQRCAARHGSPPWLDHILACDSS